MSKPIRLKLGGQNGTFILTCASKENFETTRLEMAMKGLLPVEKYKKATETGVEYVLVYSLFKIFPPLYFN